MVIDGVGAAVVDSWPLVDGDDVAEPASIEVLLSVGAPGTVSGLTTGTPLEHPAMTTAAIATTRRRLGQWPRFVAVALTLPV